ncbi:hypothetical protein, partial [Brevibacillus sp. SIMBA_040]|uniref:hypothetical protein n=1 Tax=Brevibacillus sp. SIMBA_040 TaxID=3085781 RepID=UPI003979BC35
MAEQWPAARVRLHPVRRAPPALLGPSVDLHVLVDRQSVTNSQSTINLRTPGRMDPRGRHG